MVNTVGNIKLMYKIFWKYNRKYYVEVKSGFTEKEERDTEKSIKFSSESLFWGAFISLVNCK